jgi:hypothetical protein
MYEATGGSAETGWAKATAIATINRIGIEVSALIAGPGR